MKFTRKSQITGKINTMDLDVTLEQVARYNAGTLIQDAFPNLDKDKREFLLTGITPEEWQIHMGSPEPDDWDDPAEAP